MIQKSGVWPTSTNTNKETWKDAEVRANLDKVAKAIEAGNMSKFGTGSNVQIGENDSAEAAGREAGKTVREVIEMGD